MASDAWRAKPKTPSRCMRSGKPLGRYFPEIVAMLQRLPDRHFVIVIEVSFDYVTGGRCRHGTKLLRLRLPINRRGGVLSNS
jgi:ATP-dependent DNA ligase